MPTTCNPTLNPEPYADRTRIDVLTVVCKLRLSCWMEKGSEWAPKPRQNPVEILFKNRPITGGGQPLSISQSHGRLAKFLQGEIQRSVIDSNACTFM